MKTQTLHREEIGEGMWEPEGEKPAYEFDRGLTLKQCWLLLMDGLSGQIKLEYEL
jgi:hypothetical protein